MIRKKTQYDAPRATHSKQESLEALLTRLDRATFARMVMAAKLPTVDSRALMAAFDDAKG